MEDLVKPTKVQEQEKEEQEDAIEPCQHHAH